ncbi:MAG: GNAT family N-acetyltransferase [Mycobacterium kyogaense]|uniref:GNAT family N-acetyltransferase n=1 Tax=Mycobacterium kyogaense TaxID=2212479 RepID=UPI002FF48848
MARIITEAYEPYIERIGRPPAPMTVDYGELITSTDHVHVVIDDDRVAGVLVLIDHPDHVFVDSVAVAPQHQGRGLGRVMLDFAEQRARDRGLFEVRLYTNAAMTENLALYPHLGYVEVDRHVDEGYSRVYFVKAVS